MSLFLLFISRVSSHKLVEIYLVTVEIRAVNAGISDLAVYGNTASAAHSRTIDHDRVERNDGLYTVRLGGLTYEFHHRYRTYRNNFVKLSAAVDKLFQLIGNKAVVASAAVIGAEVKVCAYSCHLVLEDNYVLASEACDKVYFYAHLVQSLSLRISDSAANAAANYCYSLDVAVLGSNAERTYYVKYLVALVEHSAAVAAAVPGRAAAEADLRKNDRCSPSSLHVFERQ